jgi:hypothetical protein
MVELRIPRDKTFLLEEGELDSASWLVFLGGHCHSLAIALNEHTGWPLVAIDDVSGECVHVAVRSPSNRIVDITGAHTPAQMIDGVTGGGRIRPVSKDDVGRLSKTHGWAQPAATVAAAWVEPVLEQMTKAPRQPMKPPVLQLTRKTAGGVEVRILWDGEPEFTVKIRPTSSPDRPWTPYGHITLPKDPDGVWRMEFYLAPFEHLAETWLHRSFDERRAELTLLDPSGAGD